MEMSKDVLEYLVDMGKEIKDYQYSLTEYNLQRPEPLALFDLTGLAEYVKAKFERLHGGIIQIADLSDDEDDAIDDDGNAEGELEGEVYDSMYTSNLMIRVTPKRVELLTPLYGEDNSRDTLAYAEAHVPAIHTNMFLNSEEFIIFLLSCFEKTDNRDLIMSLVGNLSNEQTIKTADDGVSQRVTVKTGISSESSMKVQNPVVLRPRQTFIEVEQPDVTYVLRFRDGGGVGLFEADGGAWAITAVDRIKDWLAKELADTDTVTVIA